MKTAQQINDRAMSGIIPTLPERLEELESICLWYLDPNDSVMFKHSYKLYEETLMEYRKEYDSSHFNKDIVKHAIQMRCYL